MVGHLEKEHDNKKAREGFIEAARTLELTDIKELHGLAETMFKVNFYISLSQAKRDLERPFNPHPHPPSPNLGKISIVQCMSYVT